MDAINSGNFLGPGCTTNATHFGRKIFKPFYFTFTQVTRVVFFFFWLDECDLIKSIQLKAPIESIIVAKEQISNRIAPEINQSQTVGNQDLSTKKPEKVDNS